MDVVPKTIDDYIAARPPGVQRVLEELRQAVREAAPTAAERISYGMPAFALNGNLVYFGAFKDHIGFFPTSSAVAAFGKELSSYDTSKGTVRFPLDEALPLPLIHEMVLYRVKENLAKKKRRALSTRSRS